MSVGQMAANIKQRQKIAHASSYMQRIEDARKDTIPSRTRHETQKCGNCKMKTFYKWTRCPSCESEALS